MRDAAQDLAQQAGHAPGRTGMVFRTVADVALIGTVVINGALASMHLWRTLFPRPPREDKQEDKHGHEPEQQGNGGDRPPRRHAVMAAGHDRGRE